MKDRTNDILNSYQRLNNCYKTYEKNNLTHSKRCCFFKPINKVLRDIKQKNEIVNRPNNG